MRRVKKTQKKEINFYKRYYYDPEAEARKKSIAAAVIPIAVLLILVLGTFGFLKISDAVHKHQAGKIEEYLTSSATTQQYNRATQLQTERNRLSEIYSGMENVTSVLSSLPKMNGDAIGTVNSAMKGAKIVSYTYNTLARSLLIVAKTSTASEVPALIKSLKATGQFETVTYNGYEDSDSKYLATISCSIK